LFLVILPNDLIRTSRRRIIQCEHSSSDDLLQIFKAPSFLALFVATQLSFETAALSTTAFVVLCRKSGLRAFFTMENRPRRTASPAKNDDSDESSTNNLSPESRRRNRQAAAASSSNSYTELLATILTAGPVAFGGSLSNSAHHHVQVIAQTSEDDFGQDQHAFLYDVLAQATEIADQTSRILLEAEADEARENRQRQNRERPSRGSEYITSPPCGTTNVVVSYAHKLICAVVSIPPVVVVSIVFTDGRAARWSEQQGTSRQATLA